MQNCHCFHIKLLHWPVLLSCLGLSCKMSFKSWLIDNFMNLTWIHLAKKKFKGTHAGMCNVRWPAEDPFSPLLMFSVFPFCQIVQLSFSCVTPLWCSLWDFFLIFYFVRWMYRNWFQNTFGFICILKLVEKMMLVLMCLFFVAVYIWN